MAKSFDKRGVAVKLSKPVGVVAQLVEHHNGIVGVRGSNPLGSTIRFSLQNIPAFLRSLSNQKQFENPLA